MGYGDGDDGGGNNFAMFEQFEGEDALYNKILHVQITVSLFSVIVQTYNHGLVLQTYL